MHKLVRSPTFNRAVHKVYRKINKIPDHEPQNGLGSMSNCYGKEIRSPFSYSH